MNRWLATLPLAAALAMQTTAADRSIDGTGNAPGDLGAAGTPFFRLAAPAYGDGKDTLAGATRPNPRAISNALCTQSASRPNGRSGSDYIWQWGQFIDHDVTLADVDEAESADIEIEDPADILYAGDPTFMPLHRTLAVHDPGSVRQQINQITSFIDASMVYGSDPDRAAALRTFSGGRLALAADGMLPFNTVDPSIGNEFSTALFRLGHTLVSADLQRIHNDGTADTTPSTLLRDAYFNPAVTDPPGAIDLYLKGMACQLHQDADTRIVEELRSFLFGAPGSGGMDLAALNLQRGREHGLPDYNTLRETFGLARVTSLAQITSDPGLRAALASVYQPPGGIDPWDDIDPWIGALAEDHLAGAAVGPLLAASFAWQFTRLAEGDAFFYLWDPDLLPGERDAIGTTRLADVILRNSGITSLQPNVFFVPAPNRLEIAAMTPMPGGSMMLLFMAQPGYTYDLRYSDDLTGWHDMPGATSMDSGDTALMMQCEDSAPAPTRFYRLARTGK